MKYNAYFVATHKLLLMRVHHLFFFLGTALLLSACSTVLPTYFGAKYPSTDNVQTFYAAKDITRPYKVIGHMVAAITDREWTHDEARKRLTERAKQVGANGIIFSDIIREVNRKTTDEYSIKAEAFIYTDN